LSTVLLVGGSSRIPLVAQLVSEQLGRPVAVDADPKNAIAKGAALAISPRPTHSWPSGALFHRRPGAANSDSSPPPQRGGASTGGNVSGEVPPAQDTPPAEPTVVPTPEAPVETPTETPPADVPPVTPSEDPTLGSGDPTGQPGTQPITGDPIGVPADAPVPAQPTPEPTAIAEQVL